MQVRAYLQALQDNCAVVNNAIVIACAEGIVKNHNSSLLASNGGHIALTKSWGKRLLSRMGFVKRKATTKAKVTVQNFEELKVQFLLDIKAEFNDIPPDLIINWDQTGVPVGSWTTEKQGSKRVEVVGVDDKRQITAVFAGSLSGNFLHTSTIDLQEKDLPTIAFLPKWHVTCSENHWANEKEP